jgi:hypothetical protein
MKELAARPISPVLARIMPWVASGRTEKYHQAEASRRRKGQSVPHGRVNGPCGDARPGPDAVHGDQGKKAGQDESQEGPVSQTGQEGRVEEAGPEVPAFQPAAGVIMNR